MEVESPRVARPGLPLLPESPGKEVVRNLVIWWLDQKDMEAIGDRLSVNFPDWLRDEYRSLFWRAGRARLWVADHFGDVGVNPWPVTPMTNRLEQCGGIVIEEKHLPLIAELPGLVTDLRLQRALEKKN